MTHRSLHAQESWFVREVHGRRCKLRPQSRAGWLLTAAYFLAMVAGSLFLATRDDPTAEELILWALLSVAMTLAFVLTAWRTSASVDPPVASTPASTRHPWRDLGVALLAALAIIGAALLGVEL